MQSEERADLAKRALLDAVRVTNLFDRRWGAVTSDAGITSAQWLTLELLEDKGGSEGMTPTELCRQLCVSKQNMTGMILRLEKKGLIQRRPDPRDRRSFRVRTTPKGSRAVQVLVPNETEFFRRQFESIDDARLNDLAQGLGTVLDHLQEEEGKARAASHS